MRIEEKRKLEERELAIENAIWGIGHFTQEVENWKRRITENAEGIILDARKRILAERRESLRYHKNIYHKLMGTI